MSTDVTNLSRKLENYRFKEWLKDVDSVRRREFLKKLKSQLQALDLSKDEIRTALTKLVSKCSVSIEQLPQNYISRYLKSRNSTKETKNVTDLQQFQAEDRPNVFVPKLPTNSEPPFQSKGEPSHRNLKTVPANQKNKMPTSSCGLTKLEFLRSLIQLKSGCCVSIKRLDEKYVSRYRKPRNLALTTENVRRLENFEDQFRANGIDCFLSGVTMPSSSRLSGPERSTVTPAKIARTTSTETTKTAISTETTKTATSTETTSATTLSETTTATTMVLPGTIGNLESTKRPLTTPLTPFVKTETSRTSSLINNSIAATSNNLYYGVTVVPLLGKVSERARATTSATTEIKATKTTETVAESKLPEVRNDTFSGTNNSFFGLTISSLSARLPSVTITPGEARRNSAATVEETIPGIVIPVETTITPVNTTIAPFGTTVRPFGTTVRPFRTTVTPFVTTETTKTSTETKLVTGQEEGPVTRQSARRSESPTKTIKTKSPTKMIKSPTKVIKSPTKIVKSPTKTTKSPGRPRKTPIKTIKSSLARKFVTAKKVSASTSTTLEERGETSGNNLIDTRINNFPCGLTIYPVSARLSVSAIKALSQRSDKEETRSLTIRPVMRNMTELAKTRSSTDRTNSAKVTDFSGSVNKSFAETSDSFAKMNEPSKISGSVSFVNKQESSPKIIDSRKMVDSSKIVGSSKIADSSKIGDSSQMFDPFAEKLPFPTNPAEENTKLITESSTANGVILYLKSKTKDSEATNLSSENVKPLAFPLAVTPTSRMNINPVSNQKTSSLNENNDLVIQKKSAAILKVMSANKRKTKKLMNNLVTERKRKIVSLRKRFPMGRENLNLLGTKKFLREREMSGRVAKERNVWKETIVLKEAEGYREESKEEERDTEELKKTSQKKEGLKNKETPKKRTGLRNQESCIMSDDESREIKNPENFVKSPCREGKVDVSVPSCRRSLSLEQSQFTCSVCSKEAEFICEDCKIVFYCSGICQAKHWKNGHHKVCKFIKSKTEK